MGNTVRLRELAVPIPAHGRAALDRRGYSASKLRRQLLRNERRRHDQKTRAEIVRKALSAPARQIAVNAGEDGSCGRAWRTPCPSCLGGEHAQYRQYGLAHASAAAILPNSRTSSRRSAGSSVSSICFSRSTKLLMIAA